MSTKSLSSPKLVGCYPLTYKNGLLISEIGVYNDFSHIKDSEMTDFVHEF